MQRLLCILALASCTLPAGAWPRRHSPVVVVISLDGLPASRLEDPRLPMPTLRQMEREGAAASAMQPINPTVTWPNHTTMVTGVNARKHHVLFNGLLESQHNGPAHIRADATRAELVHAETLYDAAHRAGLKTAQADWVAIHRSGAIDWEFEERPDPASPLVRQLVAEGVLTEEQVTSFVDEGSQEWRDSIYTRAMTDVIRDHRASLVLLHLLALDSASHRYGPASEAADAALASLDGQLRAVLDAVQSAHAGRYTTILVVSDHGFGEVHHLIRANTILERAGLLDRGAGAARAGAWAVPEGGFSPVYLNRRAPAGTAARVQALFAAEEGVARVHMPAEYGPLGLPTPAESDQAPDLYMVARPDYSFADGDGPAEETTAEGGSHGYLNTDPRMQAVLVAWGAGIRRGARIGSVSNLDVAPTVAKLLHIRLPQADGRPMDAILSER